jgi:hypothetical protein
MRASHLAMGFLYSAFILTALTVLRYAAFGFVDPSPEQRSSLVFIILNWSGFALPFLAAGSVCAALVIWALMVAWRASRGRTPTTTR